MAYDSISGLAACYFGTTPQAEALTEFRETFAVQTRIGERGGLVSVEHVTMSAASHSDRTRYGEIEIP